MLTNEMQLIDLPTELLVQLLYYFEFDFCIRCRLICSSFQQIIDEHYYPTRVKLPPNRQHLTVVASQGYVQYLEACVSRNPSIFDKVEYLDISNVLFEPNHFPRTLTPSILQCFSNSPIRTFIQYQPFKHDGIDANPFFKLLPAGTTILMNRHNYFAPMLFSTNDNMQTIINMYHFDQDYSAAPLDLLKKIRNMGINVEEFAIMLVYFSNRNECFNYLVKLRESYDKFDVASSASVLQAYARVGNVDTFDIISPLCITEIPSEYGGGPLRQALQHDRFELVRHLVENCGADVNEMAFVEHYGEIVSVLGTNPIVGLHHLEYLISAGADILNCTTRGESLIHFALRRHCITRDLITRFYGTEIPIDNRTDDGCTLLHYDLKYETGYNTLLLLNRGADVTAQDNDGNTILHMDPSAIDLLTPDLLPSFINRPNKFGDTPLHSAIRSTRDESKLLQLGADPYVPMRVQNIDDFTTTRKYYRIMRDVQLEYRYSVKEEIFKILNLPIDSTERVDPIIVVAAFTSFLREHRLCGNSQLPVFEMFFKFTAARYSDLSMRDEKGRHLVHYLHDNNTLEIYNKITGHSLTDYITLRDNNGKTLLHYHAHSAPKHAMLTIEVIPYWFEPDNEGNTPLSIVLAQGNKQIISDLLYYPHELWFKADSNGDTPVHLLARSKLNSHCIINALRRRGFDIKVKNNAGETAYDVYMKRSDINSRMAKAFSQRSLPLAQQCDKCLRYFDCKRYLDQHCAGKHPNVAQ
jgi:ankyrin repeat protein